MRRDLDTSLVRTFTTVASTGSMTMAAARLNLTQGAVSQQIKRLEDQLGCVLLDRSRRALKLTAEGERLTGLASRLLDANDEIWREMAAPAMEGEVRLGMPDDLVTTYLPPVLARFVAANPNIEVSLISGSSPSLSARVRNSEIDVALVEEDIGQPAAERLCVERLLWVGAKGGSAYRTRPLPLSMITETCAFHAPVVEALGADGIAWRTVFENGSIDTTLTTVRADLAVTVSMASVVPDDLEILGHNNGLPGLPEIAVNLHLGAQNSNPAAAELAQYLRESVRSRRAASPGLN